MKELKTTCQICERLVKSNTGVVAHHGYQRPGDGWQTASCLGARTLPYEVSSAALPPAIEHIKNFVTNTKVSLKNFVANPPETLTYLEQSWNPRSGKTVNRPEGFDPNNQRGSYSMAQRYELEYSNRKYRMEKNIEQAGRDVKRLEKRLAEWKQVWTEEQFKKMVKEN